MYIRKDDIVQVISGEARGKIAKVLRVDRQAGKVVVEGVNRVYKHVKPSQRNPKGGRLHLEMPIFASKVLLVNPELNKGVRVGVKINANGDKVRVCKKTGREIGQPLRRAKANR